MINTFIAYANEFMLILTVYVIIFYFINKMKGEGRWF